MDNYLTSNGNMADETCGVENVIFISTSVVFSSWIIGIFLILFGLIY